MRGPVAVVIAGDAISSERLLSSGWDWKVSVMLTGGFYISHRATLLSYEFTSPKLEKGCHGVLTTW